MHGACVCPCMCPRTGDCPGADLGAHSQEGSPAQARGCRSSLNSTPARVLLSPGPLRSPSRSIIPALPTAPHDMAVPVPPLASARLTLSGGRSPAPASPSLCQGRTTCQELGSLLPNEPLEAGQTQGVPWAGTWQGDLGTWTEWLQVTPSLCTCCPSCSAHHFPACWFLGSPRPGSPPRPPARSHALFAILVPVLQCRGCCLGTGAVSVPPPQGPRAWCRTRHMAEAGGQALEEPTASGQP